MSLIIDKFRKGFRFRCPIHKTFYGPFFKTKEAINDFLEWYDQDIRFIGTWMSNNKQWKDLIMEWKETINGNKFFQDISVETARDNKNTLFLELKNNDSYHIKIPI